MITVYLRPAWRALWAHPLTAGLTVILLGAGIGLAAVSYSDYEGTVLRSIPVEDPYDVVTVSTCNTDNCTVSGALWHEGIFPHDYVHFRDVQTSFTALAAFDRRPINIAPGDGPPELVLGAYVTHETIDILGVQPALGRAFTAEDAIPGAPRAVLLSDQIWRTRFSADPDILGRAVRIDDQPANVIGVMPEGLRFMRCELLLVAIQLDLNGVTRGEETLGYMFGRLRDGVSMAQADSEFKVLAAQLEERYPETNAGRSTLAEPYNLRFIGPSARRAIAAMGVAAGMLLLVVCAGVGALLTASATSRVQEFAVRSALGATRRNLIVQVLFEGFLLAFLGSFLALGVAWVGIDYRDQLWDNQPLYPFWMGSRLSPGVFLVMIACTALVTVLAGLYPALRASRPDLTLILKNEDRGQTGRRGKNLGRVLVVVNLALGWPMLVGTMLNGITLFNVARIDVGVDLQTVYTARFALSDERQPDAASRLALVERLTDSLARQPLAESATVATSLPGFGEDEAMVFPEGANYKNVSDYPIIYKSTVTPEYFEIFEVLPLQGRLFDRALDRAETEPVVIVNESFNRQYFGGEGLGRRLRVGTKNDAPWRVVIGVIPDHWVWMLSRDHRRAGLYVPFAQDAENVTSLYVAVEMREAPPSFVKVLGDELRALDPNLPINQVGTVKEILDRDKIEMDFFGGFYLFLGCVAVLLVALSTYGVIAFMVGRRTPEIGVRMALGASATKVRNMIVGDCLASVVVGLAFGFFLVWQWSHLLTRGLIGVDALDPWVLALAAAMLVAITLFSAWLPARHAARLDPAAALRGEN